MNTVLAQSATQISIAPTGEEDYSFSDAAKRAAERQAKGLTRERMFLNRQKLIASVCADFRAHFAAVYGKTDRLPTVVFNKVETAVDALIAVNLSAVNATNAMSMRRAFAHKANDMMFVERVTIVGENQLTLQEQHLGATIAIGQCEKRLRELQAKPTPDYDREKQVKSQLMKLELTKNFIEGEQKVQSQVVANS